MKERYLNLKSLLLFCHVFYFLYLCHVPFIPVMGNREEESSRLHPKLPLSPSFDPCLYLRHMMLSPL